ncbi:MAG: radical SAM protein [Spirochaetota bacterium]|nr:radical SAM protein [Spirochaetota bacterium]
MVNEIFQSIQGEGHFSGYPCSFIRLSGCNLNCNWCDTKYAHGQGTAMDINEILSTIDSFENNIVEITGGEPLLQDNVYMLFDLIHQSNKRILLETNGSILLNKVPEFVHIIMDIKTPNSGGYHSNFLKNLSYLKRTDEIKIIISCHEDFEWILEICNSNKLFDFFIRPITLQPVFGKLAEHDLAHWILSFGKSFKMGMQLHKYIFGEFARGV